MDDLQPAGAGLPPAVPPDDVVVTANLDTFLNYLRKTVPNILGVGGTSGSGIFEDKASQDAARKFLTDPQIRVILVQKVLRKEDEPEGEPGAAGDAAQADAVYVISTEIAFKAQNISSVGVLKRGAVIDTDKDIAFQVIIFDLKDGSPHETFHSIISGIMSPYFKSFIRSDSALGK